jgi:hypothetical protein
MSACSTDTKMSTQSSFSLKFVASNDTMTSTDTLISPKEYISPFSSDANMSKKSMEFEAMIEEYPSRILKASLTPSLCD